MGTTTPKILIVDDEPEVRSVLRRGLESQRYEVVETGSLVGMMRCVRGDPDIDLITLDLSLGQEDALPLASQLRSIRNVPIVMISGRNTPMDRVAGLEHGADDYIVKPFHVREVLLRIRTVLHRYALARGGAESSSTERFVFEAGTLDTRRRELIGRDGTVVDLTDSEYEILLLLLREPGRVMSRDDVMLRLKGRRWSPLDRTIDGVIARLRRKIEPCLETPRLIRTVWGVGYVFSSEVTVLPRA